MPEEATVNVVIVVGNPKTGSRTRRAAELVAARLAPEASVSVIEVAELGAGLLSRSDPAVASAKMAVLGASLLVVASPTYKGAYTGLLKLFLDQFGAGEIRDVPTVAVMLGAGLGHAQAVQHLLVPVLVEIGCSCPAPGLYLLENDDESSARFDEWLDRAGRSIASILR